jgi:hypothetical protein
MRKGLEWLRTDEHMPELKRKYWISDGKSIALGEWDIKNMWWKFLWHYTVFDVKYFLPIKLPELPHE